jgi:hypothetical protein
MYKDASPASICAPQFSAYQLGCYLLDLSQILFKFSPVCHLGHAWCVKPVSGVVVVVYYFFLQRTRQLHLTKIQRFTIPLRYGYRKAY